MEWEWADKISTIAIASLKTAKHNKVELLPVTEDLVMLKKYCERRINQLVSEFTTNEMSTEMWRKLAEITLAWVLLLNKRRGSEVSKLLIKTFVNRPTWRDKVNKEFLNSFTELEKTMIDR